MIWTGIILKWGYPHFNAYVAGVDSVLADTFSHAKGADHSRNGKRREILREITYYRTCLAFFTLKRKDGTSLRCGSHLLRRQTHLRRSW